MARVPLRPWIEYAFEQRHDLTLVKWVLGQRNEDRTWDQIAQDLHAMTDHVEGHDPLTGATLRNWFHEVDPHSPRHTASVG